MTEPLGATRTIRLTVYDGTQYSEEVLITLDITNTNDAPAISLDGSLSPTIFLPRTYTEGEGNSTVLPDVRILDSDPTAMIQK